MVSSRATAGHAGGLACQTPAMARLVISVTESVFVARPPDEVFDFTQDYAYRAEWDAGVTSATVLGEEPRRVRVAMRGLGEATLTYQPSGGRNGRARRSTT